MDGQNSSQASDGARREGAVSEATNVEGMNDEAAQGEAARAEGASVSVVVPSYNHAPFVEAALRSVFKQTLAPARLLVIDDGSQGGSPRVLQGVPGECPLPPAMIARGNPGRCATLNEGL